MPSHLAALMDRIKYLSFFLRTAAANAEFWLHVLKAEFGISLVVVCGFLLWSDSKFTTTDCVFGLNPARCFSHGLWSKKAGLQNILLVLCG